LVVIVMVEKEERIDKIERKYLFRIVFSRRATKQK
jgi:hypothetical protein